MLLIVCFQIRKHFWKSKEREVLPFPRIQTENYSCLKRITLSYANIRSKRKKKNNLSFASLTFQKNNVSITFSMILKILQILLTLFVSLTRYKKSIHCVCLLRPIKKIIFPQTFLLSSAWQRFWKNVVSIRKWSHVTLRLCQ